METSPRASQLTLIQPRCFRAQYCVREVQRRTDVGKAAVRFSDNQLTLKAISIKVLILDRFGSA